MRHRPFTGKREEGKKRKEQRNAIEKNRAFSATRAFGIFKRFTITQTSGGGRIHLCRRSERELHPARPTRIFYPDPRSKPYRVRRVVRCRRARKGVVNAHDIEHFIRLVSIIALSLDRASERAGTQRDPFSPTFSSFAA